MCTSVLVLYDASRVHRRGRDDKDNCVGEFGMDTGQPLVKSNGM